jgi:NAD(P)H-dependent FMN reductase
MTHIEIISSSIRRDRKSHRVALFLKRTIDGIAGCSASIADLDHYDFPLFEERLKYQDTPLKGALQFAASISAADAVIIVTPEYNGGYPASLKNVIDLLTDEWKGKPVAISTVSDGRFGGSQVITSLQFVLFKMGAVMVPAMFPVASVDKVFDESGNPDDPDKTGKRALTFIGKLLEFTGPYKK